jgi:hypothetical protein
MRAGLAFLIFSMAIGFGASEACAAIKPLAGAAVVSGRLQSTSPSCQEGKAQAWFSRGKILLYQTELPVGGTFEFHAKPGRYNLVITGSTGCFTEIPLELKAGEAKQVVLELTPMRRVPASADHES